MMLRDAFFTVLVRTRPCNAAGLLNLHGTVIFPTHGKERLAAHVLHLVRRTATLPLQRQADVRAAHHGGPRFSRSAGLGSSTQRRPCALDHGGSQKQG